MSYQVLARKYRPRFFREMVGQEHVLKALINALDTDRLHHAYLFTGTRGVGKTSLARILAKCLNCEVKVSSEPCGKCHACLEINEGRFVDLIEVDAASRTRVEDTRELLDNVQYSPTKGRYKIYLIDEVHMLSTHSFNALLKTLEEPPAHVKFLLATTDPQKLPATILSRCLQFNLKNLSARFIVSHLSYLLDAENIQFEEQALWSLAHAAKGSMRDALSLTDHARACWLGDVSYELVSQMLGTIDQQSVFRLAEALVAHDASELLSIVDDLSAFSPDYEAIINDLLFCLHRLTIAQTVPSALDDSQGDRERLLDLAQKLTAEELQLFYQMGLLGKKDLPLAPDPRTGLEMTLLRMLTFRPQGFDTPPSQLMTNGQHVVDQERSESDKTASKLLESPLQKNKEASQFDAGYNDSDIASNSEDKTKLEAVETVKNDLNKTESSVTEAIDLATNDKNISMQPINAFKSNNALPASLLPSNDDTHFDSPQNPSFNEEVALPEAELAEVSSDHRINDLTHVIHKAPQMPSNNDTWLELFSTIPFDGLLKSIARQTVLFDVSEGTWIMFLDQQQAQLFNDSHPEQMSQILSDYFRQDIVVEIRLSSHELETPEAFLQKCQEKNKQQALKEIKADVGFQSIIKDYTAKLEESTVVFTSTGDIA